MLILIIFPNLQIQLQPHLQFKKEVAAWQEYRDNKNAKVNWRFTTEDARVKLSRLYPTLDG